MVKISVLDSGANDTVEMATSALKVSSFTVHSHIQDSYPVSDWKVGYLVNDQSLEEWPDGTTGKKIPTGILF